MASPYQQPPSARWSAAAVAWIATRLSVLTITLLAGLLLSANPATPWYLSSAAPRNPFAVGDSLWYLDIARGGYGEGAAAATRLAFFPLFPLLIRGVYAISGGLWRTALLVPNLALLGALLALASLTGRRLGDEAARRAPLYLAAFPFSFYFSHAYAESLFLLLTVLAFLAAERGRWARCGVAGALAALTRPFGILLVLPCGVWALRAWRARRRQTAPENETLESAAAAGDPLPSPLGPLLAGLGPLAGLAAYSAYCFARTGNALAWLSAHQSWGYRLGFDPLRGYESFFGKVARFGWHAALTSYPYSIHGLIGALAAAAFVLCLGLVVRRLGPAYFLWSLAALAVPLGSGSWDGLGRYCAVNFPVFMALAVSENRLLQSTMTVAAAVLLGLLAALFVAGHPLT